MYGKERRGAKIEIWGKGDIYIEGELIAVKQNSLLLLNTEGKDESVDIADIEVIRVKKKPNVGQGLLYGLLIGGGGGVLSGFLFPIEIDEYNWGPFFLGILGGVVGLLLGGISGAFRGSKIIHFEGMTDWEIQETLDYLHKKARVRDYK
ncbi:MAG: hypothetical protein ACFFCW_10480 [Candidatus Hodarchaeota archaeon]